MHHDEMNDANVSHPDERVVDAWMKWRTGGGPTIKDMSLRCETCTTAKPQAQKLKKAAVAHFFFQITLYGLKPLSFLSDQGLQQMEETKCE